MKTLIDRIKTVRILPVILFASVPCHATVTGTFTLDKGGTPASGATLMPIAPHNAGETKLFPFHNGTAEMRLVMGRTDFSEKPGDKDVIGGSGSVTNSTGSDPVKNGTEVFGFCGFGAFNGSIPVKDLVQFPNSNTLESYMSSTPCTGVGTTPSTTASPGSIAVYGGSPTYLCVRGANYISGVQSGATTGVVRFQCVSNSGVCSCDSGTALSRSGEPIGRDDIAR